MTLQVFSARISSRDPDRFDVTRKSGGASGEPFAPSWKILGPALEERAHVAGLRAKECHAQANSYERGSWDQYVRGFISEMRTSYRSNRPAWDALLARPRVVLVCFCVGERCHRHLLRRDILPKLGAVDAGELAVSTTGAQS